MDEQRKSAILLAATILAARKLNDSGSTPWAIHLAITDAIEKANRILEKIDDVFCHVDPCPLREVFLAVNRRVSTKLTRFPTTHETSLDMSLIEEVSEHSAPVQFSSGWLVHLETHYLGGGRYWGRWEIADIGVLIVFRRAGVVQQTKIALLQSKRLYAVESHTTAEDHPIDYLMAYGQRTRPGRPGAKTHCSAP